MSTIIENEYFVRQELELRKKWARERAEMMDAEEKTKLRALHLMKCPKCGMDLYTIELHGISVDQCAACMGAWLDGREIGRLLERGSFERVMSVLR